MARSTLLMSWSVYQTTLFLGKFNPLNGWPLLVDILLPKTESCPSWISRREEMPEENISWSISTKECCQTTWESNPRPPDHQLEKYPTELPKPTEFLIQTVDSCEMMRMFGWHVDAKTQELTLKEGIFIQKKHRKKLWHIYYKLYVFSRLWQSQNRYIY